MKIHNKLKIWEIIKIGYNEINIQNLFFIRGWWENNVYYDGKVTELSFTYKLE